MTIWTLFRYLEDFASLVPILVLDGETFDRRKLCIGGISKSSQRKSENFTIKLIPEFEEQKLPENPQNLRLKFSPELNNLSEIINDWLND